MLEKFRSVQDKARRTLRFGADGEESPAFEVSELKLEEEVVEPKSRDGARSSNGISTSVKDAAPAVPPKKTGLGRQFGRLGGAVSGKNKRIP